MTTASRVRWVLPLTISIASVVLALSIGFLIIALSGAPADQAAIALLEGAFGGSDALAGTIATATPLVLIALAWIVAFSGRLINVGLEGQIIVGGIAAAFVALHLDWVPAGVHLSVAVLAGVVGGAAFAGIAALLWARRDVNEIISTFMLYLIAVLILGWLLNGPLQESSGTFQQTDPIQPSAQWPKLAGSYVLTWDVLFIPVFVVATSLVLRRTTAGFRLRLVNANPELSRHAGVSPIRTGAWALTASGALAGAVGSSLVLASPDATLRTNFSAGYGFDGIAVGLLARNSPVAAIPAAVLFAVLRQGGGLMEARVGVSDSLVEITVGTVVVVLAASSFLARRSSVRLAVLWQRLKPGEA